MEIEKQIIKKLDLANKDQIKKIIENIIKIISQNKYESVLNIINKNLEPNKPSLDKKTITEKLNHIIEKFKKINDGELYFQADTFYYFTGFDYEEDYDYTDTSKLGNFITNSFNFGLDCFNNLYYKEALVILDLIITCNYCAFDEEINEYFNMDIEDLKENHLITLDLEELCLLTLYVVYQTSSVKKRAQNIYNYFNYYIFNNLQIYKMFLIKGEQLKDKDEFFNDWFKILMKNPGNRELNLLLESVNYYKDKEFLLQLARESFNIHPELYLEYLKYLKENNRFAEIKKIGLEAINNIDKQLIVRSDIASLVISIIPDPNVEEYSFYLYEAFISNPNVSNLIKIFANDQAYIKYISKIQDFIKNIKINNTFSIKINNITTYNYCSLNFFLGDFREIEKWYLKSSSLEISNIFFETIIYLLLLYLHNNKFSNSIKNILEEIFQNLGLNKQDNIEELFIKWKNRFPLDIEDKKNILKKLEPIIDQRITLIVNDQIRNLYKDAAQICFLYGEVLESFNIDTKENFISKYKNMFPRHRLFLQELKKLVR